MNDALSVLLADGVITEVIGRLKSGKEADIYLVQHVGEIVAAKVYKEKAFRSFRNDAAYREGRKVRNSRTQRAIDKGSRFGQAAAEDEWKATEAGVLEKLFAAGVRVPKPYLFHEGVLLMEAVIDAEGHPAPRLIDAPVTKENAAALYADIRTQAIAMLLADLIHADLSPYNVLLAWNGPTLIDFPQVVGAAHNNRAEFFFTRDLETIRRFFEAFDPSLAANSGDARNIWRTYSARELRAGYTPPLGSAHPPRGHEQRAGHGHRPRHGDHRGQSGGGQQPRHGEHRGQSTGGQQPRHAEHRGQSAGGQQPRHGDNRGQPGGGQQPRHGDQRGQAGGGQPPRHQHRGGRPEGHRERRPDPSQKHHGTGPIVSFKGAAPVTGGPAPTGHPPSGAADVPAGAERQGRRRRRRGRGGRRSGGGGGSEGV